MDKVEEEDIDSMYREWLKDTDPPPATMLSREDSRDMDMKR